LLGVGRLTACTTASSWLAARPGPPHCLHRCI